MSARTLAAIKTPTIKIPRAFYDDHAERDLPAPGICKATKAAYWIDALSRDLGELLDDAEHYASPAISARDFPHLMGLKASARATAKAIRAHLAANAETTPGSQQ